MKLLHVCPFYEPAWSYGGMARAASGLCRALARRGHEVTVATALLDHATPADEMCGGVHVHRFPGPAWLRRRLAPWAPGLRAFLALQLPQADIAHLHGHRSGLAITARGRLEDSGVPWVLQPHGTLPHHGQRRWAKRVLDLWAHRVVTGASALLAVSHAEARDLPRPAHVVPNGVEAPGSAAPSIPGGGVPQLLFVGSDSPQKSGIVLPQVLAALPDARLRLVGHFGADFQRAFRPVAGRVCFDGVLAGDALAQAYSNADLLVHPATGEAFGLAPFEAALLGTAGVVAGGHGCGEWYGRAGGCVTPPGDIAAFIAAVRARVAEPERAAGEAGAVAEFARRELTWDRAAEGVERVYEAVVREERAHV